MKKTRFLAALLCVMMVMTIVPMMASAEETTYDTIEDILNFELLPSRTYNFTAANASSLYSSSSASVQPPRIEAVDCTFDTSNGMTVGTRWRVGGNNMSYLGATKAIYFRAKVNEGESVVVYMHIPDTTVHQDCYEVVIDSQGVKKGPYTAGTQLTSFVTGTDFVEYLAVDREDGNGLFVYAKKADQYDGKWVPVLNMTTVNATLSDQSEIYFSGKLTVQEMVFYDELRVYNSVGDILGFDAGATKNYDFTKGNNGVPGTNVDFDEENGATISGNWRVGGYGSSSLGAEKAIYFTFKADATTSTSLFLHIPNPDNDTTSQAAYCVMLNQNGVVQHTQSGYSNSKLTTLLPFNPGTAFAEYLAVDREDGNGLIFYARQDGQYGGKWVCIAKVDGYYGSLSTSSEFYMTTAGSLKNLIMYGKLESFDSIEEILGFDVTATKNYDLTKGNNGIPGTNVSFDEQNGATLNHTAASTNWRIGGYGSSSLGAEKAIYFRAKATAEKNTALYLHIPNPNNDTASQAAYCLEFGVNGFVQSGYTASVLTNLMSFAPGTEFAEYLAIDTEDGNGLFIYAKQEGQYNGKWVCIANIKGYYNSLSTSSEFYLANAGSLSNMIAYEKAVVYDSIEEIVGTTFLPEKSFTDFMRYDTVKDYSPVENRFFTFRAKVGEEKSITVYAHDYHTEKNVYAFRITKDALLEPLYKNSANPAHIVMTNGFIPGTDYQEYLVAENQAGTGIVVYVKRPNNSWYNVLEVVGHAHETPNNNTYGLYIPAVEDCVLESATIYTRDSLVLADGSGNPLYEDSTLSTPAALVVKGNGATGKVLVVTYKGDDMAKAQILDAASLTAEGTSVDASADGATKVKVFNWDNFAQLNRVNPAITLGL